MAKYLRLVPASDYEHLSEHETSPFAATKTPPSAILQAGSIPNDALNTTHDSEHKLHDHDGDPFLLTPPPSLDKKPSQCWQCLAPRPFPYTSPKLSGADGASKAALAPRPLPYSSPKLSGIKGFPDGVRMVIQRDRILVRDIGVNTEPFHNGSPQHKDADINTDFSFFEGPPLVLPTTAHISFSPHTSLMNSGHNPCVTPEQTPDRCKITRTLNYETPAPSPSCSRSPSPTNETLHPSWMTTSVFASSPSILPPSSPPSGGFETLTPTRPARPPLFIDNLSEITERSKQEPKEKLETNCKVASVTKGGRLLSALKKGLTSARSRRDFQPLVFDPVDKDC